MHKSFSVTQPQSPGNRQWRSIIADIILAGLVLGPLAAPFLAASELPPLPIIANIIYFMGGHVCPQPDMALAFSPPWLMAVCMRCFGTLVGVVATRFLYAKNRGTEAYWLHQHGIWGFLLSVFLMLFYPAELVAQHLGFWSYNNYIVTAFGLVAGLGLGLLIVPLLHARPKENNPHLSFS